MLERHREAEGRQFPSIELQSLANTTVKLPKGGTCPPYVLLWPFRMGHQKQCDAWKAGLIDHTSGRQLDMDWYEIPTITGVMWRPTPIHNWIDNGMRSGIPVAAHPHITTMYQSASSVNGYLDRLGLTHSQSEPYLLLLAGTGTVLRCYRGMPTEEAIGDVLAAATSAMETYRTAATPASVVSPHTEDREAAQEAEVEMYRARESEREHAVIEAHERERDRVLAKRGEVAERDETEGAGIR
ncbi:hypothetical protein KIPB_003008 [Kipferlia bialata]|uniref:Uncharacterized protein n=1 Tax=Kipferlia bialata TaxID=797122 RepID=A0A9K3GH41_9EUKA|nr:hypothetical protein KIPB_003008 [Kipferlia bialata]|eukprot:g3008.t1